MNREVSVRRAKKQQECDKRSDNQTRLSRFSSAWRHRLRIRILRILEFPKIREFLRILKLSVLEFIKFKLSHSSPQVPTNFSLQTQLLNFGLKILWCLIVLYYSTVYVQCSDHHESPAASLSSPVPELQSSTAHCPHSTVLFSTVVRI